MYTEWTAHLKDVDDKRDFENEISGAKPVLQRLAQILNTREDQLEKTELSAKQFENPNWAYHQAFKNGFRASLAIVNTLINLDQQKESNDPKFIRTNK